MDTVTLPRETAERVQIVCGDALEVLRTLDAGSVALCLSSPPYFALRAYLPDGHPDKHKEIGSEPTPDAFVATMVAVFREVRRVLRDDGVLVINLGMSHAGSGKGPTGHNGIGDQAKRQGFVGVSGGIDPSRSLSPAHVPACGSGDKERSDSQETGSAYSGLCDGCLADFLSHRDRSANTSQPQQPDVQPSSQTGRDSEHQGSAIEPAGVAPLVAQESTTLESWRQRRGACSRCASRAASFGRLGTQKDERVIQQSTHVMIGLSGSRLSSDAIQGQNENKGDIASTVGASVRRNQDTASDFSSCLYSNTVDRHWKSKDLMLIPFMVAEALRQDGWYLRSVIPWLKRNCLSGGAWVYARSQKGDMPMTVKELARLDPSTVQLWNGERWTRLVKVWRVDPEGDPLEIRLRSGETIGCTPDHRWPTQRGLLHARDLLVGDVIQSTRLPEREDARRPSALDDDDIGWFVGLYIAEGYRDGRVIHIASHTRETERQSRLERIVAAYDGTCWTRQNGGNSMTINLSGRILHGILDTYTEGVGAAGKHLTTKAWQRSDAFLRAVLDGYLHGDGYHDERNRRWRLGFCKNERWALDLRVLCSRLGIGLRLHRAQHHLNGRKLPGWRGQIRFEREARSIGAQFLMAEDSAIVGIGKSKGRSFWDIEIADDPHLFTLASGVLTHNSMPESVTDRPASAVEYLFLLAKSPRYYWDGDAIKQSSTSAHRSGNGYDRPAQIARNGRGQSSGWEITPDRAYRNSDAFFQSWQGLLTDDDGDPLALIVNPAALKAAHFASFPPKLVEPFVKAGSRKGDTVLDPFFGAGTVGLVANRLGRHCVGIDLNPDYCELARRRIAEDAGPLLGERVTVSRSVQPTLFEEAAS